MIISDKLQCSTCKLTSLGYRCNYKLYFTFAKKKSVRVFTQHWVSINENLTVTWVSDTFWLKLIKGKGFKSDLEDSCKIFALNICNTKCLNFDILSCVCVCVCVCVYMHAHVPVWIYVHHKHKGVFESLLRWSDSMELELANVGVLIGTLLEQYWFFTVKQSLQSLIFAFLTECIDK